jgi:predicted transcriptional regulator
MCRHLSKWTGIFTWAFIRRSIEVQKSRFKNECNFFIPKKKKTFCVCSCKLKARNIIIFKKITLILFIAVNRERYDHVKPCHIVFRKKKKLIIYRKREKTSIRVFFLCVLLCLTTSLAYRSISSTYFH